MTPGQRTTRPADASHHVACNALGVAGAEMAPANSTQAVACAGSNRRPSRFSAPIRYSRSFIGVHDALVRTSTLAAD